MAPSSLPCPQCLKSASVVLMCGLPGSGKSTLASTMASQLVKADETNVGRDEDDERMKYNRAVLIDYDDIASDIAASSAACQDAEVSAAIPATNGDDVAITQRDESASSSFDDGDLQAWRESRNAALLKLEDELTAHFAATYDTSDTEEDNLLVILDDNFHLRSMRRDVYKVCQRVVSSWGDEDGPDNGGYCSSNNNNKRIGFSVIFVDTPLETCLKRNATREGKAYIPEDTIRNMDATIERPESDAKDYMKKFETYSIVIEGEERSNTAEDLYKMHRERIRTCLQGAWNHPVSPPQEKVEVDPEVLRKEREQTLKNRVHRADRLLRTLVGAIGRTDKSMGRTANDARKDILQRVRSDRVCSGEEDIALYERGIVDEFKKYLVVEKSSRGGKVEVEDALLSAVDKAYENTI